MIRCTDIADAIRQSVTFLSAVCRLSMVTLIFKEKKKRYIPNRKKKKILNYNFTKDNIEKAKVKAQ